MTTELQQMQHYMQQSLIGTDPAVNMDDWRAHIEEMPNLLKQKMERMRDLMFDFQH